VADLDGARVALEQGLQVARGDGLLTAALDQVLDRIRERLKLMPEGDEDGGRSSQHSKSALRPPSAHRKAASGRSSRPGARGSSGRYGSAQRSGSAHSSSELDGAGGSHHGSSFDPGRRGSGRALMTTKSRALSCRSLSSAAPDGTFESTTTIPSVPKPKGETSVPRQVPSKAIRTKGANPGLGSGIAPTTTRRTQWRGKSPRTVSEFVKQHRAELREQMRAVRAELDLIDRLAKSSKRQKLNLLFGLIDSDQKGAVESRELAKLLRSRNQLLPTDESLKRALLMIKAFDADGNVELDRDEFEYLFQGLVQHMNVDFDELVEYLSLELSFATADGTCPVRDDDSGKCDEESESTSTSESESTASFHEASDDPAEPAGRSATHCCPRGAAPAATPDLRRQSSEWSLEYPNRELVPLSPTPAPTRLTRGTSSGSAPASKEKRAASSAQSSGAQGVSRASRVSSIALSSSSWH
jgi:uncharacterized protein YeaO (DUF488 family)